MSANACYSMSTMIGRPPEKEAPEFGKRVAAARKEQGLTQTQLATALGTSRKMIDYYERRATNVTTDVVKILILSVTTLPIVITELAPCMFVGTPCSGRHFSPVLTNSGNYVVPHLLRFGVLAVTKFHFRRRSSSPRQRTGFHSIGQLITNQIDNVTRYDTRPWLGSLAVDFNVPAGNCGRRPPAGFVEARKPKPLIDA